MEAIRTLTSTAAPLPLPNIDTDQIIPKQFLKRIERSGFGEFLFFDWRHTPGKAGQPFVLDHSRYRGSSILLAGKNFGCGSSREHAVWALADWGVRTVIAPSFGDIFRNNCFQNGLLPIVLAEPEVARLMAALAASPGARLKVDLERQTLTGPLTGPQELVFEIDPFRKQCLLAGTDEIGFTLGFSEEIAAFEAQSERTMPWLTPPN